MPLILIVEDHLLYVMFLTNINDISLSNGLQLLLQV